MGNSPLGAFSCSYSISIYRDGARIHSAGIVCQVLNARNDEEEATIIAQAGALNAVTISTNMAGRGTDIRLGGGRVHQYDAVKALGGLHVIGAHRFESCRIDNQLRGRAVNITEQGIDFQKAGLKTPAATWTYIVNDNPLGNWTQRLRSSVKRAFTTKSG